MGDFVASESTAIQQTKAQIDTRLLLEQANVRFYTFNTEILFLI